jgi:hypothetical protein
MEGRNGEIGHQVNGVGKIQIVGKGNGKVKDKLKELYDRLIFIFELRAYDKEKRNEYLTLEKAIKTQQEIDRILNTEYAYDLTNNKEEE